MEREKEKERERERGIEREIEKKTNNIQTITYRVLEVLVEIL